MRVILTKHHGGSLIIAMDSQWRVVAKRHNSGSLALSSIVRSVEMMGYEIDWTNSDFPNPEDPPRDYSSDAQLDAGEEATRPPYDC